jgi:hypothetical protein
LLATPASALQRKSNLANVTERTAKEERTLVVERKGNADDVVSMVAQKHFCVEDGLPSMALVGANSLMRAVGSETGLQKARDYAD